MDVRYFPVFLTVNVSLGWHAQTARCKMLFLPLGRLSLTPAYMEGRFDMRDRCLSLCSTELGYCWSTLGTHLQ